MCFTLGCKTCQRRHLDNVTPMPPAPTQLFIFSKPPIVDKIVTVDGTNYVVTTEYINNTILYKYYFEKVEEWRKKNQIP